MLRIFSRRVAAPASVTATRHPGGGGVRRPLAASSKTPPAPSPSPPDKAKEAMEKAQRLHVELNELIAAQKARNAEELQRPFGAGFLAFLKASKPEIINIFFAFVCVLLAYQIHGMRAGMKKLLAAREEKEAEIVRLRGILSELCAGDAGAEAAEGPEGDTFSQRLALKCAGLVREMFEDSESRAGYSWILGKKLARVDSLESQRLVDDLHPLILAEIQSEVGDAAFTPEEMRERRVAALQAEGSADGGHGEAARVGDLMQVLEQVHDQDLADGTKQQVDDVEHATTTTVRRARYAI